MQGYFRDITVEGFDYGIRSDQRAEVNPTLEYVTLRGQQVAGYLVEDLGSPNMRKVLSDNTVPFLRITGGGSHVVLLDSDLGGGSAGETAIEIEDTASQLFARNVSVTGYGSSIDKAGEEAVAGDIGEYVSSRAYTLFDGFPAASLNLPVEESPVVPWEQDLDQWANVEDYPGTTVGERVQNAMNSGKSVVYFPRARYFLDRPITLPSSVRMIEMLYSRLNDDAVFEVTAGATPLAIYHSNRNGSQIRQTGARPLIVRNASFGDYAYTASEPSVLYLESSGRIGNNDDFCPPQMTVYSRGSNNESKQRPGFVINGGTMWCFGFKTESPLPSFAVSGGGHLEVLGGLRTEVNKVVDPMLVVEDANVSLVAKAFLSGKTVEVARETQQGVTRILTAGELPPRQKVNGYFIPLFVASTDAAVPNCLTPAAPRADPELTSATLTLDSMVTDASAYGFRYRAAGDSTWQELPDSSEPTTKVEGLREGARYELQARVACGTGTYSPWSESGSFTQGVSVDPAVAPTIDGTAGEGEWKLVNLATKVAAGTTDNAASFDLLWDATYLYVAIAVRDANLVNDSEAVFRDDAVEVFIDVDNNGGPYDPIDLQLIRGYDDPELFVSRSFDGEILHASSPTDTGYTVELAIPWSGLGITPESGFTLGFDVAVDDDDDGDARDGLLVWSGTGSNFNTTDGFGEIVLSDEVAPPYKPEPSLYWTWDGVFPDEVTGKLSSFSSLAGFSPATPFGSQSVRIIADPGTEVGAGAVSLDNGGLLNSAFSERSYSLWARVEDVGPRQLLFEEGGVAAGVAMQIDGGTLEVLFRHGTGANFSELAVPYPADGAWHHIGVTYQTGTFIVYMDGVPVGRQTSVASAIPAHANPSSLGGIRSDQTPTTEPIVYLRGYLDELKLFNSVLTATEMAVLAENPSGYFLRSVTFTRDPMVVGPGSTYQAGVVLEPQDADLPGVSFRSLDPAVITIDPVTGLITAVGSTGSSGRIVAVAQDDRLDPGFPPADTALVIVDRVSVYWPLDDKSGSTAEDRGPAATFDGFIVGGVATDLTTEGLIDGAFAFAPVDNQTGPIVNLVAPVVTDYPFSVSAWVHADRTQFTNLFTFNDTLQTDNFLAIGITGYDVPGSDTKGVQPFIVGDDAVSPVRRADSDYNIRDGWHFLTLVADSPTDRSLYVDGQLTVVDDRQLDLSFANQRITLGGGRRGPDFDLLRYRGLADEFRFHPISLDSTLLEAYRVDPIALEVTAPDTLDLGGTGQISALVQPLFSLSGLTFSSADATIVSTDAEGNLTARSLGSTSIRVSSVANPDLVETAAITVAANDVPGCSLTASDFPEGVTIVDIARVTYADFATKEGSYVTGVAAGTRADGRAGAWEIHNDCGVYPLRRTGADNVDFSSLLPAVKGMAREWNWQYRTDSITNDGRYIYATAVNAKGYTHKFGWTVLTNTQIPIRYRLGEAFFGRIGGVTGEILCSPEVRERGDTYFVVGCTEQASNGSKVFQQPASDVFGELNLTLYPNPAKTEVRITGIPTWVILSATLTDVRGRKVRDTNVQVGSVLDVSDLAPGVYQLMLRHPQAGGIQLLRLLVR